MHHAPRPTLLRTAAVALLLSLPAALHAQGNPPVFIDELTWTEIRDRMQAGTRSVIIGTAGQEQKGPHMVDGEHKWVLTHTTERIARALGDALVAPIVTYVPEGSWEPARGHMAKPGTITLPEDRFVELLVHAARSLKNGGFTQIIYIGDSGGNQAGQRAVADSLTALWKGAPVIAHIQEYYDYASVAKYIEGRGVKPTKADGLHDDPEITMNMFIDDPRSVRYEERVKAGKADINGVSLKDKKQITAWAKEIVAFRAQVTTDAINKAIANKGTLPAPARRSGN